MTDYTIAVADAYEVPAGSLTSAQYVTFVMNKAAESYMNQYNTADVNAGIDAACAAYNAALPQTP